MKRLKIVLLLMVFGHTVLGQAPTLFFRFNNAQTVTVGETDYFQFDVEVRADIAGTYHRDMQVYFDYNPAVFGERIKLNNRVTVEKIGIMAGEVFPGFPKYRWVNELVPEGYGADNTFTRYYISSLPSAEIIPSDQYHNLMPTEWAGYMRVRIEIVAPGPAGIKLVDKVGEVNMMDGGQYYFDPVSGSPIPYTFPFTYVNDLLDHIAGTIPTYSLSLGVSPAGAGAVSGAGEYAAGAIVPVSAVANPCYTFVNWTDGTNVVSTSAVFDYVMPAANASLTANFQLRTYAITASAGAGGSISPAGTVTVNCGGSQAFTITPTAGYMISDVLVDGVSVGAVSAYTFENVTANHTISASFILIPSYTLTLAANPAGGGTLSGGGSYQAGSVVPLSANPNSCYSFVNWTSGSTVVSTTASFNYTMPAQNVTLTANFLLKTYTITASAGSGGSISPSGAVSVNCGADQAFTIIPTTGFMIEDVLVDGSSVGAVSSYTFYDVVANHTIAASFSEIPATEYVLSLNVNPAGTGTVTGAGLYEEGEVVSLTATANPCYSFVNWTNGSTVVSTSANFSYTMPAQHVTLTANFQLSTYAITASAGSGGSISPSGTITVNCGSNQAFTITPASGFMINDVLVDGSGVGAVASYTFTNVTANHTISASFALIPTYVLTLAANPAGGGTVSGGGSYQAGSVVPLTTNPNSCYSFVNWTSGSTVVSTSASFNYIMPAQNTTLTANFLLNTFTISATAGSGGSISPSGGVTVNCGADQTFTIIPAQDYVTEDVLVDGVSVGAVSSYTFNDVSADHTISASFAEVPPGEYVLSLNVNPAGAGSVSGAGTYEEGEVASLTATANACYSFVNWTLGSTVVSTSASFDYTMPAQNVTLSANFLLNTYTITASAGTGGSISPGGPVTVNCGADQAFTITPATGYLIEDVLVDGSSVGAVSSYAFTNVVADHTIAASFTEIPTYTLTLEVNPAGAGEVTGGGDYQEGTIVSVTATENTGYAFVNWTLNEDVISNLADFDYTMPAQDVTLTAHFEQLEYTLTLLADPQEAGVVSGGGSYFYDQTVEITATPNDGYLFVNWTGDTDHVDDPSLATTQVLMPAEDISLTAVFEPETGIPEVIYEGLKIYPNPAQTDLWVELINPESRQLTIQLTDLQGRIIDSKTIAEPGQLRIHFNVSKTDPGVYLVAVKGGKQAVYRKVVLKP